MLSRKSAIALTCILAILLSVGLSSRPSGAQTFRVASATLEALPEVYQGRCPATVRFEGNITVNGPGTVRYTFLRSDGATSPVYTLEFKREGTQPVSTTWSLGGAARPQFSEWVSIKIISPNEVESPRAGFKGDCSGAARRKSPAENTGATQDGRKPRPPAPPRPGDAGPSSDYLPLAARFRVTINGFACHRPTFDDETQRDGVDDEVFVQADLSLYGSDGARNQPSVQSAVIGDTNGFPARVRGGSGSSIFGGNGGFHENDTFPADGRPWARTSEVGTDRPPMLVWEGELTQYQNGLLIIPSIWEWDGDVSLELNRYVAALATTWSDREVEAAMQRAISAGGNLTSPPTSRLRSLFQEVRVSKAFPGDPKNRPIGMTERGDYYTYNPHPLVLTYDSADYIAKSNNNDLGRGVVAVEFSDDARLRGLYSLYIQVEKLPAPGR
jgi:hypothetical protein